MNEANVVALPDPGVDHLPAPLVEYADRLLLSTGLTAEDALRIASGVSDPPDELLGLARALRVGWALAPEGLL